MQGAEAAQKTFKEVKTPQAGKKPLLLPLVQLHWSEWKLKSNLASMKLKQTLFTESEK